MSLMRWNSELKGCWQAKKEDEVLQKLFWEYFKSNKLHGVIRAKIGSKFLRQHKETLFSANASASL